MLKIELELETFKHIINEGQGFRGGSDEKMRRMWLGREVVVAGLPLITNLSVVIYDLLIESIEQYLHHKVSVVDKNLTSFD